MSSKTELSPAAQAAAAFLLEFGRCGFDTDDLDVDTLACLCEAWVAHLTDGGERPGARRPQPGVRDWPGAREFVRERRQAERDFVGRNVHELRDLIWLVVRNLGSVVNTTTQLDRELSGRLTRLRTVAEATSGQDLRTEVLGTVDYLQSFISEQMFGQAEQLESLGGELTELRDELQQARKAATTDPLTRLFNRAALDQQLQRTVELFQFCRGTSTVVMVDLDHFKALNDTHGHAAGDTVLRAVADCLVASFPRRGDFVARYGGEEFCVILTGDDIDGGKKSCERFLKSLRKLRIACAVAESAEPVELRVTASLGLAELQPNEAVSQWVQRADAALYVAKESGRDRISSSD
ncbi:MAG: GGDEF domain-containing protein [Planctomycetota bacterium]